MARSFLYNRLSVSVVFKGEIRRLAVADDITALRQAQEQSRLAAKKAEDQNVQLRLIAYIGISTFQKWKSRCSKKNIPANEEGLVSLQV